ncbi:glycosyltransferase family 2 protein [Lewinella sp. 4G2]|uniref:glycosyltransferase family 2 protein n=1 Tax=Lewinella sp. 4G2 TaxID=1803372 RepID=UPI0007B4BB64|nr:glycosyltransferase family 2 protein [Lewinella sp. 4G2]OAV45630.1 glycosyl transferase family 2 [Lewinella sp. 4G2]
MDLSVVIVNYNVQYFLEQALISVERALRGLDGEVFVVDNASVDGSVAMVRDRFPWVKVIANTDNPGFAVANNQAIRQAKGKYVLVLNPDTVVEEDTFTKCFAFMEAHPDAGALGVRMIDGTGQFLPESKRGLPTPWVAFTKAFGLASLFPKSRKFGGYHLKYLEEHETHPVPILAGAFMWVRASALPKVGLLDEAFFMYGEDIDWSYRFELAGYRNYYFPETSIIHYKGESTKRGSLNYVKVFYQAMIIFAKKHFAGSGAQLYVKLMQVAIYLRALLTIGGNVWRALRFPLIDAVGIYCGLRVIKYLWAQYHFGDATYFPDTLHYVHFPIYTLLWTASVFLGGGYERPADLSRLFKSLGIGTLVVFSIYGLLPEGYRPSRALLLLGAAWAAGWMLIVRTALQYWERGTVNFSNDHQPRLLIVGNEDEAKRTLNLLQRAGAMRNFLGRIHPVEEDKQTEAAIGFTDQLVDYVRLYRAEELIYCAHDVSNGSIQRWMSQLGPAYAHRILPPGSNSIIGSRGKNSPGTLYTIDVHWVIEEPVNRRAKWLFDKALSLTVLLTWPFHAMFTGGGKWSLGNAWSVLTGQKTWVGYATVTEADRRLPKLRPGVVHPGWKHPKSNDRTLNHLNLLYARDYSLGRDLAVLFGKGQ